MCGLLFLSLTLFLKILFPALVLHLLHDISPFYFLSNILFSSLPFIFIQSKSHDSFVFLCVCVLHSDYTSELSFLVFLFYFVIFNWSIIAYRAVLVSALQHQDSTISIYPLPHEPPSCPHYPSHHSGLLFLF